MPPHALHHYNMTYRCVRGLGTVEQGIPPPATVDTGVQGGLFLWSGHLVCGQGQAHPLTL